MFRESEKIVTFIKKSMNTVQLHAQVVGFNQRVAYILILFEFNPVLLDVGLHVFAKVGFAFAKTLASNRNSGFLKICFQAFGRVATEGVYHAIDRELPIDEGQHQRLRRQDSRMKMFDGQGRTRETAPKQQPRLPYDSE